MIKGFPAAKCPYCGKRHSLQVVCQEYKDKCADEKSHQTREADVRFNNLLSLRRFLTDIHSRATRKDRACSEKKYLAWDLEHIAETAHEAINKIDKLSAT